MLLVLHPYCVSHLWSIFSCLLFSVGEQDLKLNIGHNPTDSCLRGMVSLNSQAKTVVHECRLWASMGRWGLSWRTWTFIALHHFNQVMLRSRQIILVFFSKFPTFKHVTVTGTPNDAEHGWWAFARAKFLWRSDRFLYCFLTSSINSSHTATLFGYVLFSLPPTPCFSET